MNLTRLFNAYIVAAGTGIGGFLGYGAGVMLTLGATNLAAACGPDAVQTYRPMDTRTVACVTDIVADALDILNITNLALITAGAMAGNMGSRKIVNMPFPRP